MVCVAAVLLGLPFERHRPRCLGERRQVRGGALQRRAVPCPPRPGVVRVSVAALRRIDRPAVAGEEDGGLHLSAEVAVVDVLDGHARGVAMDPVEPGAAGHSVGPERHASARQLEHRGVLVEEPRPSVARHRLVTLAWPRRLVPGARAVVAVARVERAQDLLQPLAYTRAREGEAERALVLIAAFVRTRRVHVVPGRGVKQPVQRDGARHLLARQVVRLPVVDEGGVVSLRRVHRAHEVRARADPQAPVDVRDDRVAALGRERGRCRCRGARRRTQGSNRIFCTQHAN